jgi:hypothetical protein
LGEKNAIPTDIMSLSQPLTRGQMAEMIFRIKTQNNDKPSKSFADLTGHAYVSQEVASASSKVTSSAAAKSSVAAGAFPYNLVIDSNWQTTWNLKKIEATDESLKNITVEKGEGDFPQFLRVHFPAGSVDRFSWKFYKLPLGGFYGWIAPSIEPQKTITLSYSFRVPSDFAFKGGGSLPALLTGMQNDRYQESAGSLDLSWDKNGYFVVGGNLNSIMLVHPTSTSLPRDGKWHRIDMTVRLQTMVGKSNGMLNVAMDGSTIASANDVTFLNRTNDLWDGFSLGTSLFASDGASGPKKDEHIDLAGFSMNTNE